MSQNRSIFSMRFLSTTTPLLNAIKSPVISSAIKMNSQHDPKKKLKNGISMVKTQPPPANCKNHATRYPTGVFQSNGTLENIEKQQFCQNFNGYKTLCVCALTQLKIPYRMIRRPSQKCNNWRWWTIKSRLSSNGVSWIGQNKIVYRTIQFCHSTHRMCSSNDPLRWAQRQRDLSHSNQHM